MTGQVDETADKRKPHFGSHSSTKCYPLLAVKRYSFLRCARHDVHSIEGSGMFIEIIIPGGGGIALNGNRIDMFYRPAGDW